MNEIIVADLDLGNNPQPPVLSRGWPSPAVAIYAATGWQVETVDILRSFGAVDLCRFRFDMGGPVEMPIAPIRTAAWRFCWGKLARHLSQYYPYRAGLSFGDMCHYAKWMPGFGREANRLLAALKLQIQRRQFGLMLDERRFTVSALEAAVASPKSAWRGTALNRSVWGVDYV